MVGRGACVCEGFSFTTFVPTIRKNEKKKTEKSTNTKKVPQHKSSLIIDTRTRFR
jgi:hypothetical protein